MCTYERPKRSSRRFSASLSPPSPPTPGSLTPPPPPLSAIPCRCLVGRYENASVFHQTEWVDVDTITINLAGNLVLLLLALTFFWSSRRHYPSYFSCKRYFLPDQTPPDLPSSGFLSWIL